ncbi:MAG: hypothetical protein K8I00_06285 [Candidatus Omnitrophica bacterium]|nr:hypothetical protein [Candidatus Omnitrophota bacterium]
MDTSDELTEQLKSEWRELGFHYVYNHEKACWIIRGSNEGMRKFCKELTTYAKDECYEGISEHEHYGPYSYLKFVTWNEADITSDAIFGRLEDFTRLSRIIETHLEIAAVNSIFSIAEEYAPTAEAYIEFHLENDDFDPASADTQLWDNS